MSVNRAAEIARAGDSCEKCGWLAWSNERHSELQLRAKVNRATGEAVGWWVLCPPCTDKHDRRHRRGAA